MLLSIANINFTTIGMVMTQLKIFFIIVVISFLVACGGGGAKVESTTTSTTMGQELMDLDESFKKGLLTEKEYKKAKENIMKRYQ